MDEDQQEQHYGDAFRANPKQQSLDINDGNQAAEALGPETAEALTAIATAAGGDQVAAAVPPVIEQRLVREAFVFDAAATSTLGPTHHIRSGPPPGPHVQGKDRKET